MSVSLCVLRIETDEDLSEMADSVDNENIKEQKKKDRGARESRTITVETYASIVTGSDTVTTGILPTSSRRNPPQDSVSEEDETISFFCGNPLVEVAKGVLHLYKENELKEAGEARTLCLLRVPGALGARDLLAFAAACQQDIAHVRVLRDGSADHYMALLTFRTPQSAQEFHAAFDGVPYSSLEPNALCHIAWVSRVEWARDGTPPPSHTELPTCPVCLERMDESVAGVLSVQCAHAFHADCLVLWRDASCPVCRCAQTPEPRDSAACFECDAQEGEGDESRDNISGLGEGQLEAEGGSLWICLICGHVGCGRYEKGHAAKHFLASNHTYALQLGSNRVWDYAGDNFVHRLVQNKADGKLVAAEGGEGAGGGGKPDAQLEFTYMLTHQLDSQRAHYEDRIAKLESEHLSQCERLGARAALAEGEAGALRRRVDELARENRAFEKRLHQLANKSAVDCAARAVGGARAGRGADRQPGGGAPARGRAAEGDSGLKGAATRRDVLRGGARPAGAGGRRLAAGAGRGHRQRRAAAQAPPEAPVASQLRRGWCLLNGILSRVRGGLDCDVERSC